MSTKRVLENVRLARAELDRVRRRFNRDGDRVSYIFNSRHPNLLEEPMVDGQIETLAVRGEKPIYSRTKKHYANSLHNNDHSKLPTCFLSWEYQMLPVLAHPDRLACVCYAGLGPMPVLFQHVELPVDEPFRLLRLCRSGSSEEVISLEPNGRTRPASGLGGRWHSHPEMEFTIMRGRGMRYVGDHVEPFGPIDCVLIGGNVPHCWMNRGPCGGYVLQYRMSVGKVWPLGGIACLDELIRAAARGLFFERCTARKALRLIRQMAAAPPLVRAGMFLQLLGLLHAHLSGTARPLSRAVLDSPPDSSAQPRLEAVVQWMLENFTEPLKLEEAVERSAMSRATFS